MATHSSTLAWRIPWTEELGGWATVHRLAKSRTHLSDLTFTFTFTLVNLPSYSTFSSVQFSHSVMFNSLRPHGLQHTRPPCPSPTPGVYSNLCQMSRWCHLTISSSVVPFSSCPQSFPASVSFQMSQFFASDGQSIGISASVFPINIPGWFPLGSTGLVSLVSKGLSRVLSSTIIQKHQFFGAQPSLWSNTHINTWLLEKPQHWLYGLLLAK